jgi:hypothetical protein
MANSPRREIYLISINETRDRTKLKKGVSVLHARKGTHSSNDCQALEPNRCVRVTELKAVCLHL